MYTLRTDLNLDHFKAVCQFQGGLDGFKPGQMAGKPASRL